jgi:hypothetical protein
MMFDFKENICCAVASDEENISEILNTKNMFINIKVIFAYYLLSFNF